MTSPHYIKKHEKQKLLLNHEFLGDALLATTDLFFSIC
jgi:hypothetical protein